MKQVIIYILIAVSLFLSTKAKVRAQGYTSGIADKVNISEQNAPDGSIICNNKSGFGMCNEIYAPGMYGVLVDNPAAYFDTGNAINGRTVLTKGIANVRVTNKNGNILKGDYVTSSATAGIGQKATENGYVLGTAIEDTAMSVGGLGQVTIAINIHPEAQLSSTRSNLVSVLRDAAKAPLLEPLAAFRYVLAALLVVIAFTLGFIYFGRMANTGVEAIGRNPLAERQIRLSVIMHLGVTVVIVAVGLFSAYLVLIL